MTILADAEIPGVESSSPLKCGDNKRSAVCVCAGRGSENAVQWSAGDGELVDSAGNFRILNERRGVMRFDSGVDDQRASTAPMLVLGE